MFRTRSCASCADKIGRNYRNQGEDIITSAHGQLVVALFEPQSADGKGLRVAFVPRVQFRAADAIRAEQKDEARAFPPESTLHQDGQKRPQSVDPRQELDERMDVDQILSHVRDERKRLAFRLYLEDYPLESKRSMSIAATLGSVPRPPDSGSRKFDAELRMTVGEQL